MNHGLKVRIKRNVSLAPFTTFKIGGRAKYFAEVKNKEEAMAAIEFAKDKKLPIFILGGGSNILISDEGFRGLVIRNSLKFFTVKKIKNKARVRIGSGEKWDVFVERAVRAGWGGIENLSGVPGTIGAAPVQNIGCYGQSVEKTIVAVKALDIASEKTSTFGRGDCKFGYRTSVFRQQKSQISPLFIIKN
ncbi:MAG: FAD-binding protein [Patescibacteria group bacterium]